MFRVGEASRPYAVIPAKAGIQESLPSGTPIPTLASLDSGLRRNDGLRWEQLLKTEQLPKSWSACYLLSRSV